MATVEVTSQTLATLVEENSIVLLDFWASWCGPCRSFAPVFEQASLDHPDLVFGKVDTEAQPDLAASFGITSIPMLAIYKDGTVVYSRPGALRAKQLEKVIADVRQGLS